MFGIIRPCRNRLGPELRDAWLAHLCGLCLALRDDHGHLARVVTNYDGLMISAMVEAQSPAGTGRRAAGPCALRGMRPADVSYGQGARLAAAVSLVLASAKVRDHADDEDGAFAHGPVRGVGRAVAQRWATQAADTGSDLGFDTSVLVTAVRRQAEVEQAAGLGSSVLLVTEPTETAGAEAVAQTAVIAGRPENAAPLREVGRLFGRLAHLLDAVEDLEADRASGAWNPLIATGTDLTEARRLCEDAALGIKLALREATFTDDRLVHALLVHELKESIRRAFGEPHSHQPGPPPGWQPGSYPQQQGSPPGWQPAPGMYPPPGPPPPPGAPGQYPPAPPPPPPGKKRRRKGGGDGPGSGLWAWPPLVKPLVTRDFAMGCLAVLYQCGTCQYCCRDPYPGPWGGKWREAWCDACDCSGCDCSCCDSCDCCGCDCNC
jgi:hypothetical protein